jgi:murein DD-endopeptidase MepM/ murein hydrolase activator NlpD
MKTEYWTIVIALVIELSLGGMMGLNTVICRQQAELMEMDSLRAETYWTRIAAMPKPYSLPLEQLWISSGTGYRQDPMGGTEERLHKGLDLAGKIGDPVYAVRAGVCMEHWIPPDGKTWKGHPVLGGMITIQHKDGFSIYGHLSETYVHEEDWIETGQIIGRVGETGHATGPHLHFEYIVDPLVYLEERR